MRFASLPRLSDSRSSQPASLHLPKASATVGAVVPIMGRVHLSAFPGLGLPLEHPAFTAGRQVPHPVPNFMLHAPMWSGARRRRLGQHGPNPNRSSFGEPKRDLTINGRKALSVSCSKGQQHGAPIGNSLGPAKSAALPRSPRTFSVPPSDVTRSKPPGRG